MKTYTPFASLLLALTLLGGCGSPQPTPSEGTGEPSTTANVSRSPHASATPETAACDEIRATLNTVFQAEATAAPTTFNDLRADVERTGCRVTATGRADTVGSWNVVADRIQVALIEQGWKDPQPLADGPTGTVIGLAKQEQVAQLTVDWQPIAGASCPTDQPISACTLAPDQQQITVIIELGSAEM